MTQKRERKNGAKPKRSPNDLVSSIFQDGIFSDTATGLGKQSSRLKDATCFRDRYVQGFLSETYGGGQLERVDGFNSKRALTDGLDGCYRSDEEQEGDNENRLAGSSGNLETVFLDPRDDRVQISNAAEVPWRALCHLRIVRPGGGVAIGTGWVAGPNVIVTAGHNYFHHHQGGFASSILITAGADGSQTPFFPPVRASRGYVHRNWQQNADPAFDYAFLYLDDDRLGRRTGSFSFADADDRFLNGVLVNIGGYPFDKPYETLWYSAGRIFRLSSTRVAHRIDTTGGYSGAPLIYKRGDERIVLGMHTQGDSPDDQGAHNAAVRITGSFFDDLKRATGFG